MANLKRPELKLVGNVSENFKNFELRFNDYCIQANYRNLAKDPITERADHYKSPLLEISALRSSLPDEALSVLRYTIEPQILNDDKKKPWVWMEKLRAHYTGSTGSSLLTDRFKFWTSSQTSHESIQEWEVKVRQASSLCAYGELTDELTRDKFIFGLHEDHTRTELLKTHVKPDNSKKTLQDVVAEARAIESAKQTNKLIVDSSKGTDEEVHWTGLRHNQMKLRREPGTCFWCGDRRGPHPWKVCPAKGKTCSTCGGNDHFARVCLEDRKFTLPDTRSPASNTRSGRKEYTKNANGQRRDSRLSGQRHDPRAGTSTQSRDLHYTDTYVTEEQPYDTPFDHDCGFTYSLEAQVHSIAASSQAKRYFTTLSLSATGSAFTQVKFQIDTAATCNTMSINTLRSLLPDAELKRSPYRLYPYGNSKPLEPEGQVDLVCERKHKYETLTFQVLPDSSIGCKPALLSGSDSERLGLIKVLADEIHSLSSEVENSIAEHGKPPGLQSTRPWEFAPQPVESIPDPKMNMACNHLRQLHEATANPCNPPPSPSKPIKVLSNRQLPPPGQLRKEDILDQYANTFEGLGELGPPVHFQIDESIQPVQMPVHRIPVAKREREKQALDRYVEQGVIAKVNEPTAWCSNELIRETPKKFRVCIDPSQTVNRAIHRPKHQMPTLNEQLHKLSAAKCFSLVDVKEGFLHIPLDEDSSWMTTMHTSYGRYRWLRLPFGITSAPEEFQMRLTTALEGLEGIICIADDILVYGEGNDYEEAQKDHDRRFIALMECCHQKNIRLNAAKLQFKLKELKFMGTIISDQGMKPDPDKVAAITQIPPPENKAALLRFIGMVNYLSPFCANLSSVIQPLRMLTQEAVPFIWSNAQDNAFTKAKQLISSAPVLAYYDLHKPVVLQTDASDYALGGALLQPNDNGKLQPVAFTSSSMSTTEQRYSQIEKECLAICNCFQKFDQWLYGKADIVVHTDHQPLETIIKKPLNKAPARLQRMLMKLQRYRFHLTYKRGATLHLADTLSRAALPQPTSARVTHFDVFRMELESEQNRRNPRLEESTENHLREQTSKDVTLAALYKVIVHGWPEDKSVLSESLRPYWNYRDELSVKNGIIYKGTQVMVPQSMHKEMLRKIHANHFGAESNIRMAREVLFWPGMRKSIQDMCDACGTCAQYGTTAPKEPMKSLPIPTRPWQIVSQDICELHNQSYLVTVCHFSDWIEVDKLGDTLSSTVIEKTKAHFARYGVPAICHTDNGPQFISNQYRKFSVEYGFKHTTSSPYHPKGNGRAEAAVKVAESMLKKADDFHTALLLYRNTPPQGHTYSPAQRMFLRRTATTLPTTDHLLAPAMINFSIVKEDILKKRHDSKAYYDKSAGVEHQPVKVGSYAYAKPPPRHRGKPWIYGEVIKEDNGRSYTIRTSHGTTIRRNRVQLKPAAPPPPILQPQIVVNRATVDATANSTPAPHPFKHAEVNPQGEQKTHEHPNPAADAVPETSLREAEPIAGSSTPLKQTRSGRIIKPPERLKDYVTD